MVADIGTVWSSYGYSCMNIQDKGSLEGTLKKTESIKTQNTPKGKGLTTTWDVIMHSLVKILI